MNFGSRTVSVREAVVFGYTVAGLLMLDVVIRALLGGYDAGRIGGADTVIAIAVTVHLFNGTRLGRFARG